MISVRMHLRNGELLHHGALSDVDEALNAPGELLWIDVCEPGPAELEELRRRFHFHPLALEDVARQQQRAKIESYDGYSFLVFYALAVQTLTEPDTAAQENRIRAHQVSVFLGRNYLVTVHDTPLPELEELSQRWERNADLTGSYNLGLLLYSLLDTIVDGYFPVIDSLSDRIEELEEAIFGDFDKSSQQEIFRLKKDLLAVRRAISPERDLMNVLVRRDTPIFDSATLIYMQDVYDHILRVIDAVDTYRDLLSSALDAYLSVTSNRLNQVMKTLTTSSIILMSMTLVASIYGMNFVHMPELGLHLGYPLALGLMMLIGLSLAAFFRRIDWL